MNKIKSFSFSVLLSGCFCIIGDPTIPSKASTTEKQGTPNTKGGPVGPNTNSLPENNPPAQSNPKNNEPKKGDPLSQPASSARSSLDPKPNALPLKYFDGIVTDDEQKINALLVVINKRVEQEPAPKKEYQHAAEVQIGFNSNEKDKKNKSVDRIMEELALAKIQQQIRMRKINKIAAKSGMLLFRSLAAQDCIAGVNIATVLGFALKNYFWDQKKVLDTTSMGSLPGVLVYPVVTIVAQIAVDLYKSKSQYKPAVQPIHDAISAWSDYERKVTSIIDADHHKQAKQEVLKEVDKMVNAYFAHYDISKTSGYALKPCAKKVV